MPTRLVILTDDVFAKQLESCTPGSAESEALGRLGHAGYAIAMILAEPANARGARSAPDPQALQDMAHVTGGQVSAFLHRGSASDGLAEALIEVAQRWRADLSLVPCISGSAKDLATIVSSGGLPVALTAHLANDDLPPGCRHHRDLATFVDVLLDEQGTVV